MDADFKKMIKLMKVSFQDFEAAMPRPELVKLPLGWAFRFKEKNIYEAIIQKLAMVQSCVQAAYVLLKNGFVQEQAMLHRVIDETNEDIIFLVDAITNNKITPLHERYLSAFWEEEFDNPAGAVKSSQKREMIPRKKIIAHIAKIEGSLLDPSSIVELRRTLSKTYSGFVHGASPHIMESYGGRPPHFHTQGMLGTPRIKSYRDDLWNYMYRSFLSHIFVAKAFGAKKHVEILIEHKNRFEKNANKQYRLQPNKKLDTNK